MRRRLLPSLCCMAAAAGLLAAISASAAGPRALPPDACSVAAGGRCVRGCTIPVAASPGPEHAVAPLCKTVPPVRPCVQPAVLLTAPPTVGEPRPCASAPFLRVYPHGLERRR